MSMAPDIVTCSSCDFRSSTSCIWGEFLYVLPSGERIDAHRMAGWCYRCETIVPIEVLRKSSDLESDINEVRARKAEFDKLGFWARRFKAKAYEFNEVNERLTLLELMLKCAQMRRAPPKCMICGHSTISVLHIPMPNQDEVINTDIQHPGCSGHLIVSLKNFRLNMGFEPILFDTEGRRLN